jgi:tetrathionate reductase subunit B
MIDLFTWLPRRAAAEAGPQGARPRRVFLKEAVLAIAAAVAARRPAAAQQGKVPEWTMVIDLNRCIGCQSCVVSCKAQSRSAGERFNTRVSEGESAKGHRSAFVPTLCNQCEDPPCVAACPVQATHKLDNGVVVNDWSRCTSDGSCVTACPYGARYLDARFGRKVDKCDFCLDRLEKGLLPACVESCPPRARLFGDAAAPAGEFAQYLGRSGLRPAQPELGLKTRVLYLPLMKRDGKK